MTAQLLMWDKPDRLMSVADWQNLSADGAPPGVYVPNMSQEDRERWKARLVRPREGEPRVEIRKTVGHVQMVLIVTAAVVRQSMNGTIELSHTLVREMHDVIAEALEAIDAIG